MNMALAIKMFSLIIIPIFFANVLFIEISGSHEANKGSKAKTYYYGSISPRLGPEKGEINPEFIPEECKNMGICEEIPAGLEFNDIISRIDQSEKNKYLIAEHQIDHEHRVGNNNTLRLCEAFNKTIKPSFGQAKDTNWHRILNSAKEDIQTINAVFCHKDGEHCLTIHNVLSYHVKQPVCKQNYIWRKMAYIGINETIRHDKKFKVPISCTCKKNL